VVRTVLNYREIAKLRNTYTGPIPRLMTQWSDGRLRTVFKATRTATGRLSSGDRAKGYPNMQNIPVRGEWGKLVRMAFLAAPGNVLVGADLSQIEMRMAAHLSGDNAMCEIFRQGLDIHNKTACALFKLAVDRINYLEAKAQDDGLTPEEAKEWKHFRSNQRAPAKNLGFGVLYGLTAEGLRANIMAEGGPELSLEECEKYIAEWFAAYPGIKEWMELQYSRARRYGMVWDLVGRIRPIPDIKSQLQEKMSNGLRDAGNMPVQSGAQAVIKLAMAELTPIVLYYQSFKDVTCLPLLQIHDELISECSRNISEEFAYTCRNVMRNAVELIVPVDSSADIAERWGELK
jgi:DNA polymerase-1